MNEKLLHEFEYIPPSYHIGMAAIRLVFMPSDKLEESINEFVKPEERGRFSGLLKSDEVTRLHYTGGDANGLQYASHGNSFNGVSDLNWLRQYKRSIEQVKSQSIPVAAYRPRLERTDTGALIVELALLPNEAIKRKIGQTLLRPLRIDSNDNTIDHVVYARTLIPKSKLVDDEMIQEAQANFTIHLGIDESYRADGHQMPHEAPKTERMFVRTAFINDKPLS